MRFRKKAREHALEILYRWDIRGDSIEKITEEVIQERKVKKKEMLDYLKELIKNTSENLPYVDSLISEHLEDWNIDRLGYIERNALRLGVAELLFMNPPDPGRAFNDYIDIVKKYADRKAAKFVNGVMSKIYKKRKTTSLAKKVGSGEG